MILTYILGSCCFLYNFKQDETYVHLKLGARQANIVPSIVALAC